MARPIQQWTAWPQRGADCPPLEAFEQRMDDHWCQGCISVLVIQAEAVGLNAIFLLLMSRVSQASGSILPPLGALGGPRKRAGAADGGERGEAADAGSGSLTTLARSFQKAEALLRHYVNPGLWRLLPSQAGESTYDSEEEDSPVGLARLAQVEGSFLGLSRCLCVQENPQTETFRGHVLPAIPDAARGAFSYHPARASVARHCATLHALLRHRHHLRLIRNYSCRLKAASDFVGQLKMVRHCLLLPAGQQNASWARLLRGLCEEMRTHAGHWEGLRQHIRRDPWLRPLLLQRPEVVQHMKRALSLLALHAVRVLEGCLEAYLRAVACLASTTPFSGPPAPLSDLFQGLEIYNQVVGDRALQQSFLELGAGPGEAAARVRRVPGSSQDTFPMERVLGILAAERGLLAGQRLYQLLLQQQPPPPPTGPSSPEPAPWKGHGQSWLEPEVGEGPSGLSTELQSLCQEEASAVLPLLRELVASTHSLHHRVLNRPKWEKPSLFPESPKVASLPGWKSVHWLDASFAEVATGLNKQFQVLFWRAVTASLDRQLELRWPRWQEGAGAALGQQLSQALAQAHLPRESAEELRAMALHLLLQDVSQHWDRGFCHALGSSLTDKCMAKPAGPGTDATCSQTAQLLQSLYPSLAFSLRCLDVPPDGSAAKDLLLASLRLELLSLSVAIAHASCFWVMSKAYQYLASWSLSQFLLVTQGDLQLLMVETKDMSDLVHRAFAEDEKTQRPLLSHQEQELSEQVHAMATSIKHFTHNVLKLFSLDCKRMSAEIFGQTMPLGKYWRLALRSELPAIPSEYASAAVQTVLGQVLTGIQLLPQEAQEPALGQVTMAFLEAWMDYILAQKIKFSLQGALQLKQDFDLVRELLQSEDSGLAPEIKQAVLSLRVFQQMDNAIACLLQQPSKAPLPSHTWGAFQKCCSSDGIRTQDGGPGSLNSLESLDGLPAHPAVPLENPGAGTAAVGDLLSRMQGGGSSPETYLSPTEQEWLALRLHGGRRWRVPTLPCMSRTSES
ncbi:coiled-coil domain-containing protein 142 isoform X2 [Sceloporus undulatus]|uniref:coiled-coil domain-containing protein 142 isoform X2 n=1 Tax=Sceloporus undulatus TaxID=8520 RepID=UPI001C4B58D5|nr:coiled-coil domain-containing protein 142 isoform X2 [Sceloporus undulatus]